MLIDNFKVSWKHENNTNAVKDKWSKITKKDFSKRRSYTHCTVEYTGLEGDKIVYLGTSVCSSSDNYNKAIGRKISFTDAVSKISSKESRSLLWNKFKELSPRTVKCKVHS